VKSDRSNQEFKVKKGSNWDIEREKELRRKPHLVEQKIGEEGSGRGLPRGRKKNSRNHLGGAETGGAKNLEFRRVKDSKGKK